MTLQNVVFAAFYLVEGGRARKYAKKLPRVSDSSTGRYLCSSDFFILSKNYATDFIFFHLPTQVDHLLCQFPMNLTDMLSTVARMDVTKHLTTLVLNKNTKQWWELDERWRSADKFVCSNSANMFFRLADKMGRTVKQMPEKFQRWNKCFQDSTQVRFFEHILASIGKRKNDFYKVLVILLFTVIFFLPIISRLSRTSSAR